MAQGHLDMAQGHPVIVRLNVPWPITVQRGLAAGPTRPGQAARGRDSGRLASPASLAWPAPAWTGPAGPGEPKTAENLKTKKSPKT